MGCRRDHRDRLRNRPRDCCKTIGTVGTLNLLKVCAELSVSKFIFSSSATVYGVPSYLPIDENHTVSPVTPYGHSKAICEQVISDFCNSADIDAFILRYFNPVGAHDSGLIGEVPVGVPNNLFPYITQTIAGKRAELKIFGSDYNTTDGTAVRDYIHVVDLARAHVLSINWILETNQNIETFNIGTGVGYSVLEVVKMFEKVLGMSVNYKLVDRREGDIEKIFAVSSKSNEILKWEATKNLEDMVSSSLRWEENLNKEMI